MYNRCKARAFQELLYVVLLLLSMDRVPKNQLLTDCVAFNNAYRRILDLPWRRSASGMYATYGIYNLEAIIRKQTFEFIGRLRKSCNKIVQTLENAWIIRIQLWHTWFEVLYTNR